MLLDKLNLPYRIMVPDIDETVLENENVDNHILRLAEGKARKIAEIEREALIIGCDSVCILNGKIVSKPETHAAAVLQLKASSGKIIYFYSGLVLYNSKTTKLQKAIVETAVHFKVLTDTMIEAYLLADKPYHCAGSIKLESSGIMLVKKMISDDPNSVIGLPLIALVSMLENEGLSFFRHCEEPKATTQSSS